MKTTPEAPPSGSVGEDSGLFARQATGLVRNVTGIQSVALNLIAGMPALGVAVGIFFGLAGFPGGNFFLAILLTIPLSLAVAYAFGLQSAIMPRSGGDYMIVSRVLSPVLGLVSTSLMMVAQLIAIASLALFTVTLALAPALATVGVVGGDDTLVDWGNTVATSKGWQFGLGAATILAVGAIVGTSWSWARRFIMWLLAFGLAGLAVAAIIALFTSRSGFVSAFNSVAAPLTGEADSYNAILAAGEKGGVELGSGFSLSGSIALIGVMAGFGFYSWNTAFIAGEIREGSTLKTGHRMALGALLSLVTVAACVALFFKAWGHDFLAAAYGGGFPPALGPSPAYFFLTSAQVDNTLFAIVMSASFLVVFPIVFATIIVVMSRVIFAWAFDGVFPRAATRVNRYNSPIVATAVLVSGAVLALVWAVFISDSLIQIVVYLTLIQLTAMALVGVSAVVLPFRRPQLYRASVSTATFAGAPVVSIAGAGTIATTALIYYLYFKYDYFGLTNKGEFFAWLLGAIVAGLAFYGLARWIRAREGVDLRLTYAEIPPE